MIRFFILAPPGQLEYIRYYILSTFVGPLVAATNLPNRSFSYTGRHYTYTIKKAKTFLLIPHAANDAPDPYLLTQNFLDVKFIPYPYQEKESPAWWKNRGNTWSQFLSGPETYPKPGTCS
jgi:hypothetical protein